MPGSAASPVGYKARDDRKRREGVCTARDGRVLNLSNISLFVFMEKRWYTYIHSSW